MGEQLYKAIVNNEWELDILQHQLAALDLIALEEGNYHLLQDDRSYQIIVEGFNAEERTVALRVNGNLYKIQLLDEVGQMVRQMGLSRNTAAKAGDVKAPMPGLVLEIAVKEGEQVQEGQPLLILEAMKMENVLKSPGEGMVEEIVVQQGSPVDKGQLLIRIV